MSGNRFNRLPVSNAVEIIQLKNDMNVLVSAVEQELLKMSHKIGEEDSISGDLQASSGSKAPEHRLFTRQGEGELDLLAGICRTGGDPV